MDRGQLLRTSYGRLTGGVSCPATRGRDCAGRRHLREENSGRCVRRRTTRGRPDRTCTAGPAAHPQESCCSRSCRDGGRPVGVAVRWASVASGPGSPGVPAELPGKVRPRPALHRGLVRGRAAPGSRGYFTSHMDMMDATLWLERR